MHSLEVQTLNIIQRDRLFPESQEVIVGVSGGSDSIGLLTVLSNLTDILKISLIAVYVDHGLRPDETGQEKAYVHSFASDLQTGFALKEVDVQKYSREKKISLEHAARDLRYNALREVARENDASIIATAHTADDQAEEILIRLLRGSGLKGLSGMRTENNDIVRPFLETSKSDIRDYLFEKGIRYLEDSSNSDPRFLRNRVRNELIPFLEKKFDPGVKQALRKTANSLAEDELLLDDLTNAAAEKIIQTLEEDNSASFKKIHMDKQLFLQQPEALQRRIVEKLLWQIGSRAQYTHIMQVIDAAANGRTGTEIHLSKGLRVGVQRNFLEFVYPEGKCAWRGRLYSD